MRGSPPARRIGGGYDIFGGVSPSTPSPFKKTRGLLEKSPSVTSSNLMLITPERVAQQEALKRRQRAASLDERKRQKEFEKRAKTLELKAQIQQSLDELRRAKQKAEAMTKRRNRETEDLSTSPKTNIIQLGRNLPLDEPSYRDIIKADEFRAQKLEQKAVKALQTEARIQRDLGEVADYIARRSSIGRAFAGLRETRNRQLRRREMAREAQLQQQQPQLQAQAGQDNTMFIWFGLPALQQTAQQVLGGRFGEPSFSTEEYYQQLAAQQGIFPQE